MSTLPIPGIDIAKAKFDVELQLAGKSRRRSFTNDLPGFAALQPWLEQQEASPVHACMEATGRYWEDLALALSERGHLVSVVNPAQIKHFGQSELTRTKTDGADAALIARFCEAQRPSPCSPLPPEIRELRGRVRRLADLNPMLHQEQNRLEHGVTSERVRNSLETMLAVLKSQIREVKHQIHSHLQNHPDLREQAELIASIPGLAELTAANLLAEFGDIASYESGRQLAAYAGLSPQERLSGSSVRGRTRLCKIGSARLRKSLYMPAVVARRYNRAVQAFADRLRSRGKHTRSILGAIMRKLLHWVYGVLKSGRLFDAEFAIEQMRGA